MIRPIGMRVCTFVRSHGHSAQLCTACQLDRRKNPSPDAMELSRGKCGRSGGSWASGLTLAKRIKRRDSTQLCQHKQQQSRFNDLCLSFSFCVHNGLSLGRSREYRVGPEMFRLVMYALGFRQKCIFQASSPSYFLCQLVSSSASRQTIPIHFIHLTFLSS